MARTFTIQSGRREIARKIEHHFDCGFKFK